MRSCALIHRHRPDLLDWDKLDKSDPRVCTRLAFTIAQQHLNIPQLLDVADICDTEKPDDRSVMTYVAQYFHAFSVMGASSLPRAPMWQSPQERYTSEAELMWHALRAQTAPIPSRDA